MHEPDKDPDTTIITDKHFTVQWMANIALFGGVALSIIGGIITLLIGTKIFYVFSLISIIFAAISMRFAKMVPAERARATAALGITINVLLFVIIFILSLFFKEAAQAL